jgi:hypothetical protein
VLGLSAADVVVVVVVVVVVGQHAMEKHTRARTHAHRAHIVLKGAFRVKRETFASTRAMVNLK